MNCCEPLIIPFEQNDVVSIPYSVGMRQRYGDVPTVFVYHRDPVNGEYILANIRIAFINFPADQIKIYNGGVATGYVKITV